jgi:hypothetical protein
MNAKYTQKPIPNPNEPIKANCGKLDAARKTNPIFSRPNMRYQYQKRGNGGQKPTQKNETNPIVDNFTHPR